MFWLEDGLPSSLAPGRRPRTTLSPSLAVRKGTVLAFGTPGGDQQDQWSLEFFLAHARFGLDLQAAIDAPMFHTAHFPSSFYPRQAAPRRVEIEARAPAATIDSLRARGHEVVVADDWSLGRLAAPFPARRTACCRQRPTRAGCRATPSGDSADAPHSASGQPCAAARSLPSDTDP